MLLTQVRAYRSIKHLPTTTLPDFTVITGLNGSGKSHLLEAIRDGNISTDATSDPLHEIGLYTWNDLVPNDVGITNISQIYQHRDWFIEQVRTRKSQRTANLLVILNQYGVDGEFSNDPWEASSRSPSQWKDKLGESAGAEIARQLSAIENDLRSHVAGQAGDDLPKRYLHRLLTESDKRFSDLRTRDFDDRAFRFVGDSMFRQNFGEMFLSYFEKQKANELRHLAVSKGHTPSSPPLSEAEFIEKHGEPPWQFVNDMMRHAKLDFQIDYPTDYEATQFSPTLKKISSGEKIEFGALSSGEKVLMSFAFCIYYSTDDRQEIRRPKVLLFDEIDAPLHPSMSKRLIEIMVEFLVRREGIPTILVTHSPSTVAVSPEASIHLLEARTNRLAPESKRRAVSTLTADIPTMSIDFGGRRQVFVESDFDAERYELLWQRLAPHVRSERSLTFIGIGRRKDGQDRNTGCDQVIATVTALSNGGNTSVLGLIDWDGEHPSTERIAVVAEGQRYAIENCLLDPLLIALAVLGEKDRSTLNFLPSETYASASNMTHSRLQEIVDHTCNVIGAVAGLDHNIVSTQVDYVGGLSLTVDERLLFMNGHQLEDYCKAAFPVLKKFHQTGALLKHLIESVIDDHRGFCPQAILVALKSLCDRDIL